MDFILARLREPSTYLGIGLLSLTGGSVEWAVLSSIDWPEVLSIAASLIAVVLRENR